MGDARGFGLPSPPIPRLGPFQLGAIVVLVELRQAPGERPHARRRRPHPHRAARCGLGGLRLDPLAILRRDPVGNRAGHRVCAALSLAIERHGAAPQPCRHRERADHPNPGDPALDADSRVTAAGSNKSVRDDRVRSDGFRPGSFNRSSTPCRPGRPTSSIASA